MHAISIARDVEADHSRTKHLEQHLRISRVIAQIGDDQTIVIVEAINLPSAPSTNNCRKGLFGSQRAMRRRWRPRFIGSRIGSVLSGFFASAKRRKRAFAAYALIAPLIRDFAFDRRTSAARLWHPEPVLGLIPHAQHNR
jgi:hypothetical protein